MPRTGLLVCNHLSYLDIIALSALRSCLFVAKSEVGRWPLFGWLAQAAGTLFVERRQKTDCARVVRQIAQTLDDDLLVVLFPEGTSSDGGSVVPFKFALLDQPSRSASRSPPLPSVMLCAMAPSPMKFVIGAT